MHVTHISNGPSAASGADPTAVTSGEVATSRPHVARATAAHRAALAKFYRAVWHHGDDGQHPASRRGSGSVATAEDDFTETPRFLFLSEGDVVGHLGTIGVRFWNGEREHDAHWLKGLMVLPAYRNGPVGYALLKEAIQRLELTAALVVAQPARRLFEALGFQDIGVLPNYVAVIRPARVLRLADVDAMGLTGLPSWARHGAKLARIRAVSSICGVAISALSASWRAARSHWRSLTLTIGTPSAMPIAAELDQLWSRVRSAVGATPVRDAAYLARRYGEGGESRYDFITVRERGALIGLAVLRRPKAIGDARLAGIRVATLSDVIFPLERADVCLALLRGARRRAKRVDADAILCSASHPALGTALERQAFLRLPGNVHFLLRPKNGSPHFSTDLAQWWITRGDADADEVF
jgi:GNAT superfamily N-acetyltransferase